MEEKNRKLRILQVNKLYYPHIGGIESLVRSFSKELLAFADVKVLVCQDKGRTSYEVIEGVPVTRASSIGIFASCPLSFSFFRLFRKMSKEADVIEFHTPFPLADLACILSGYKGRVVIAWHSDVVKQKKLLYFYKPILMRFLRRADCIITATQGHIDGSSFLPEFRNKCKVIPYGIDTESYLNAKRKPILTEKLNDSKSIKILFVGRLVYYKGVDVLLKAMQNVHGGELFLVGKGTLEDELKKKAEENGLGKSVHFLGVLSDEDLKAAFADCDFFVLPSVANSEAFGIVQLEAMIYKKPVINTNLPTGVPHVSLNGETGITVEPENVEQLAYAIQKLIDRDDLRYKYGLKAEFRVISCFNEKKVVKQIYDTLKGNSL